MQQHAKPSPNSEILIIPSMDLMGKKNNYKGKQSVNYSQTPKKLIVQSIELRGNKKKYKSKKNANFRKGYALNIAQYNGKQESIVLMQPFLQHHHQMVATTLVPLPGGYQSKPLQGGNYPNSNVFVDVFVTSECIHLCILYIVTRCLFRDVSIMYLSHDVMPQCFDWED